MINGSVLVPFSYVLVCSVLVEACMVILGSLGILVLSVWLWVDLVCFGDKVPRSRN